MSRVELKNRINIEKEKKRLQTIAESNDYDRYSVKTQIICEVLWRYLDDFPIEDILTDIGEEHICRRTIFNYIKKYSRDINFMFKPQKRRVSQLKKYEELIIGELTKNPVKTYKEAKEIIKRITGLDRSIPQIKELLDYYNFKKKKGIYTSNYKIDFIKEHTQEIIEFLDNSTPNSFRQAKNMLKKEFPTINEEDEKIIELIKKYTTL